MSQKSDPTLPIGARMSPTERAAFTRALEIGWREFLGPERFEAYQRKLAAPAWLSELPQLPPRNPDGSLPSLG